MSDTVRVVVQHDQYQYVYLRHDYQTYVSATESQSVLSMDAWAVKKLDDLGVVENGGGLHDPTNGLADVPRRRWVGVPQNRGKGSQPVS